MTAVCADVHYRKHTTSPWRSDSGEIDVFDAVNYFLGEERCSFNSWDNFSSAPHNTNLQRDGGRAQHSEVRKSAVNGASQSPQPQFSHKPQRNSSENKMPKMPNSPGTKLAVFLNSLFAPSTAGRKKQKPTIVSKKGYSENPIETRKSRNNLQRSVSENSPKSLSSSSYSETETPSPFSSNGRTCEKEFNDVIDARFDFQWKCFPTNRRSLALFPINNVLDVENCLNVAWLEQNFIVSGVCPVKNEIGKNETKREKECQCKEEKKVIRQQCNVGASVEGGGVGGEEFKRRRVPTGKQKKKMMMMMASRAIRAQTCLSWKITIFVLIFRTICLFMELPITKYE